MAVDNVGVDVRIKYANYRSNGFRDIRGAVFVSNERTNIGEAYPDSAKREHVSSNNQQRQLNQGCIARVSIRPGDVFIAPLSNSF